MAGLRGILAGIAGMGGVTAALVAGRDGFLIEGVSVDGELDPDAVAAAAASIAAASGALSADLLRGPLLGIMLEYENGAVVAAPVGTEAVLAVVTSGTSNLGRVRLELRRRCAEIAACLAQHSLSYPRSGGAGCGRAGVRAGACGPASA